MSDNKCMASQDGICRNAYAFGIRCNGYSKGCKLRPHYIKMENTLSGVAESIRKAYGIKGDLE